MKYNYIIAGGGGFYSIAYYKIMSLSNVAYFSEYVSGIKSWFLRLLVRINFNVIINRYIKTPFRHFVYPLLFNHTFPEKKPLCYIFFGNQYAVINTSYLGYLRCRYPNVKLVLYFQDIVSSQPAFCVNEYKSKFDLIISYDKGDCEKYGFIYHPTPYSAINVSLLPTTEKTDVFFCGKAKSRYKTIFDVYKKCTKAGLKCLFFISEVPKEQQILADGLVYDNLISYECNISYVLNTKCILEIMQEDAVGFTPRLWEAITYDKHLLSNNQTIRDTIYFDSDYIHFIQDGDDFGWIINNVNVREEIKRTLSPQILLNKIDSLL